MTSSRLSGIARATCGATRTSTNWSRLPATTRVGAVIRPAIRHSEPAPGRYARRKLSTSPRMVRTYASAYHGTVCRRSTSARFSASRCGGSASGSATQAAITMRDISSTGTAASRQATRRWACGNIMIGAYRPCSERRGSRNGMAGDTSVSVRTRSGRTPATRTETAPPIELPTRCTGPRPECSIQRITRSASADTVYRRAGSLCPKPGRSMASPSKRSAIRPARSVQLLAEPPRPCT
jgi:hypothetical protein